VKELDHEPLIVYSLNPSFALDIGLGTLIIAFGAYELVWAGTPPASWVVGVLFFGDFYFRLWRRPVRQAQFFESHFEISGRGINLNAGYDSIRDLTKYKQPFGDSRSTTRVSFFVRGVPIPLVFPNRWNKKLGLDVYSLIVKKVPNVVAESVRETA